MIIERNKWQSFNEANNICELLPYGYSGGLAHIEQYEKFYWNMIYAVEEYFAKDYWSKLSLLNFSLILLSFKHPEIFFSSDGNNIVNSLSKDKIKEHENNIYLHLIEDYLIFVTSECQTDEYGDGNIILRQTADLNEYKHFFSKVFRNDIKEFKSIIIDTFGESDFLKISNEYESLSQRLQKYCEGHQVLNLANYFDDNHHDYLHETAADLFLFYTLNHSAILKHAHLYNYTYLTVIYKISPKDLKELEEDGYVVSNPKNSLSFYQYILDSSQDKSILAEAKIGMQLLSLEN